MGATHAPWARGGWDALPKARYRRGGLSQNGLSQNGLMMMIARLAGVSTELHHNERQITIIENQDTINNHL